MAKLLIGVDRTLSPNRQVEASIPPVDFSKLEYPAGCEVMKLELVMAAVEEMQYKNSRNKERILSDLSKGLQSSYTDVKVTFSRNDLATKFLKFVGFNLVKEYLLDEKSDEDICPEMII